MAISTLAASGVLLAALGTAMLASRTSSDSLAAEASPFQDSALMKMACIGQPPGESGAGVGAPATTDSVNCARMSQIANFTNGTWESFAQAFQR